MARVCKDYMCLVFTLGNRMKQIKSTSRVNHNEKRAWWGWKVFSSNKDIQRPHSLFGCCLSEPQNHQRPKHKSWTSEELIRSWEPSQTKTWFWGCFQALQQWLQGEILLELHPEFQAKTTSAIMFCLEVLVAVSQKINGINALWALHSSWSTSWLWGGNVIHFLLQSMRWSEKMIHWGSWDQLFNWNWGIGQKWELCCHRQGIWRNIHKETSRSRKSQRNQAV